MDRYYDPVSEVQVATDTGPGVRRLQAELVRLGMAALGQRALVWMAALGAGALWTLAILEPTWMRLAGAAGYCLTVLGPVIWRDLRLGGLR